MDLLLIITIALLLWFWWDSTGAKELARKQAKQQCDGSQLLFLDDSVALTQLKLKRSPAGGLVFYRHFVFEFCSDGQQRYAGYVVLLGKKVQHIHLDAYRLTDML